MVVEHRASPSCATYGFFSLLNIFGADGNRGVNVSGCLEHIGFPSRIPPMLQGFVN